MMKLSQFFTSIIFLILSFSGYSQEFSHHYYSASLEANVQKKYELEHPITSVQVIGDDLEKVVVHTLKSDFQLKDYIDHHTSPLSALVIFEDAVSTLCITSKSALEVEIHTYFVPTIAIKSDKLLNKKSDCEKPETISYEVWRDGLPEPLPGRNATVVKHCIIHHTAGSNENTDYVNVVRSIYLAHTQGNGWDDIGYNYLIAQDGTIFSGRDPQDVADEDNIQGAHFCSKNGGTMGIALLGNYDLTSPSQAMLTSLNELLTWKLYKENLFPYQSVGHPTSLDPHLGSIAIHQDGCATDCPGDSIETLVKSIKERVDSSLRACGRVTEVNEISQTDFKIYPNPSKGLIYFDQVVLDAQYTILSTLGEVVQTGILNQTSSLALGLPTGVYTLNLETSDERSKVYKITVNR